MTAGRKPLKQPEIIDVEATLDQARIENAMTVMRQDAIAGQVSVANDVFALGGDVGVVLMARTMKNISAVAEIKAFERICESKAFKHLQVPGPDGVLRTAENIDDFCRAVFGGRGYKAMNNHKVMLAQLGEETYEAATRIGLNRSQLRLLINLPEDTRSAVEEAMQSGDKSEVVTLIQSLANQLDEAKAKADELKADIGAKEEVLARRAEKIDTLEQKLSRVKTLPPDEVQADLHKAATAHFNDTRGALLGKFRAAVEAIDQHHQVAGGDSMAFVAGLVGQLQADLAQIRDTFGIPDVAPALIPEWVGDPSFASQG